MKNFVFLALLLAFSTTVFAQSEEAQIRSTLMNYLQGTSFNRPDQIRKAFHESSDLFLTNQEEKLWIVPSAEYIGFFNKNAGTFNGRVGSIISVDRVADVATAKAEVLIPSAELRFVDLFLLKKIEGEWKIISKTATRSKSNKTGERILIIVSNTHYYGDSKLPNGNSLLEIARAYHTFVENGYNVDFVSPKGGAVPLAYINMSDSIQKVSLYNRDLMAALQHTFTPDQLDASDYKAVHYVGGGGVMYDVPQDQAIQQLVMEVYEKHNGIVSSVCHGTAGIVNLKTSDGKYLVAGKRVNGYPDDYENKEGRYYPHYPLNIQQTIEARGGNFKYGPKNQPYVEADDRLITGQNYLSSELVALKIIERLQSVQ